MINRSFQFLLIIISIVLITACFPEWKMAKAYIASKPDISILVMPTNIVYKDNLKTSDTAGSKIESPGVENSLLLKEISDSIFLTNFTNSLYNEFSQLGFKVYTESDLDSFLFLQTPAYIFNIAQIQLEESYKQHEDKEEIDGLVYYKKTDLNALTYNFWFELSELNDGEQNTKLFFVTETITDLMNGYFNKDIYTGKVRYRYKINELDTSVVYDYCKIFGQRYAGYTFDYLMNKNIQEHWPENKQLNFYMQYKRYNHTLNPTWDDKFIEMKE